MVEIVLRGRRCPPINDTVDSNRREIHNAIPMGIPKGNSLMDSQVAVCQVADIL